MKKLALDLDSICVESFATNDAEGDARGTVRGHDDTLPTEMDCTRQHCVTRRCNTNQGCDTVAPYCRNEAE